MKLLSMKQILLKITMPMYNLIEYSDNYSDTSGSLCQFKRDKIEGNVDLPMLLLIIQITRHHINIKQVLLLIEMA